MSIEKLEWDWGMSTEKLETGLETSIENPGMGLGMTLRTLIYNNTFKQYRKAGTKDREMSTPMRM